MKKIIYILDSLEPYGAENSIVNVAMRLQNLEPIFISLFPSQEVLKQKLAQAGIRYYDMNFSKPVSTQDIEHIREIVLKIDPHIIHSTLFEADRIARKLKDIFPDIILVGSLVSNSYSKRRYNGLSKFNKLKLLYTQRRDRKSAKNVDYFISNSEAIVKSNCKAMHISSDRVVVIPRGRVVSEYDSVSTMKNDQESPKALKSFITVGRLSKNKGHQDLISAFEGLDKTETNIELNIVGEGSYHSVLKEKIKDSNLLNKVKLIGFSNNIQTLLRNADYFLFASYYEGLSGALIEAILSKTPCIVSDIPENRECFPEGGAIFFELGNIRDLTSACKVALKMSQDEWLEKTEMSYKYAIEKFELNTVVSRYDRFYSEILKNSTKL